MQFLNNENVPEQIRYQLNVCQWAAENVVICEEAFLVNRSFERAISLCKSLQAQPDEQMHPREDYTLYHNPKSILPVIPSQPKNLTENQQYNPSRTNNTH